MGCRDRAVNSEAALEVSKITCCLGPASEVDSSRAERNKCKKKKSPEKSKFYGKK